MSIDYDRLRQLVAEVEQGVAATTRYTWLDLARELLRLHRELVDLCALMVIHADSLHLDGHHYAAKHIFNHTNRLTRIIEGGTE